MKIEQDIASEQGNLGRLQVKARELFLPRKSINFQFKQLRFGNRNQTQVSAINKRKRQRINQNIGSSQRRISSLKELLAAQTIETSSEI